MLNRLYQPLVCSGVTEYLAFRGADGRTQAADSDQVQLLHMPNEAHHPLHRASVALQVRSRALTQ
jgi:hypothetical protein